MQTASSLAGFLEAPTRTAHPKYNQFFFVLKTMPESAYGEMLLGSVMRRLGLARTPEGEVARQGREFLTGLEKARVGPAGSKLFPNQRVLLDLLDFPRTASQPASRSLTLLPLVPELANYTAAVRLRGNPWNPGRLVADTVAFGCDSAQHAAALWEDFYDSVSVRTDDDVWARFLRREVSAWRHTGRGGQPASGVGVLPLDNSGYEYVGRDIELRPPARRFVSDLKSLFHIRDTLTRREWLAYLESLLRLGTVAHVQWLCHIHRVVWSEIERALRGEWTHEGLSSRLAAEIQSPRWRVGDQYSPKCTSLATAYLRARYGLNLTLFAMSEDSPASMARLATQASFKGLIDDVSTMAAWAQGYERRGLLLRQYNKLLEVDPKATAGLKGFTNNLREFWLYALAKRQTKLPQDREFDQGFWCEKLATHASAPWIAMPGPVSLVLAVHCCHGADALGRTVLDLERYLGDYGIGVQREDFSSGPLAVRLRDLGILVDSPDAESGMGVIDSLGDAR